MPRQEQQIFIFAHPDDEFACSGIISEFARDGKQISCIYLTDGGYGGQDISRRRAECESALGALGVHSAHIYQLGMDHGFPDGALHTVLVRAFDAARSLLMPIVGGEGSVAIHVPAWEGGHQDHDATHAIGVLLGNELRCAEILQFSLYNGYKLTGSFFRVSNPLNENGPITYVKRLTLKQRGEAVRLCFYHASQWKTWLGLLPFFATKIFLRGSFVEQQATLERLMQRPHAGPLLYERRSQLRFEEVRTSILNLQERQTSRSVS